MKNEYIIRALRNVKMSDDVKRNILLKCRDEEKKFNRNERISIKKIAIVTVACTLILIGTISVIATNNFFNSRKPKHHIDNYSENVLSSHINNENSKEDTLFSENEKECISLLCSSASGGGDKVYFDLCLYSDQKLIDIKDSETLINSYSDTAYVEFEDGSTKKLFVNAVDGSNDYQIRYEGFLLLSNSEQKWLGTEVDLYINDLVYTVKDSEKNYEIKHIYTASKKISVKLDFKNNNYNYDLDDITISEDGTTINLTKAFVNNAFIELIGTCNKDTELPWLDLNNAYIILEDNRTLICGSKNGTGTYSDGRFSISWILSSVTDAEQIKGICFNNKTIIFK